jgi:hypothetical protein
MSNLREAQRLIPKSARLTARELALSADLAAWAGEDDHCISIIARIFEIYDDQRVGAAPNAETEALADKAAAWIGGRKRSVCNLLPA